VRRERTNWFGLENSSQSLTKFLHNHDIQRKKRFEILEAARLG